ncbi:MAG: CNNM domain-containing protein [Planctomycetaceae bacterium]
MIESVQSLPIWLPGMVAMLVLMVASSFFSASETALFYLSHDDVRALRVGRPREQLVASLLADPDRLLTAILFWNLTINLSYFAVGVIVAERLSSNDQRVAAGVYTVASLLGIILFGEVIPKSIAVVFRHRMASLIGWPLARSVSVLDPWIPRLHRITRSLRRAFWHNIPREPILDADDLERAVEACQMREDLVQQETQVLHNVLDLSEILVEEVMRPRTSYTAMQAPVYVKDLQGRVPSSDFALIQEPDSDELQAVIPLTELSELPHGDLQTLAENLVFVPWCSSLAYTLQLLRDRFSGMAAVVNEYGETIGIVTYSDIIDTILLPQPSRARRVLRREPVLEVAQGQYHVDGLTTLRYLSQRLDIDFSPDADTQLTLAGMLHEELEHIPVAGDTCSWQGFEIQVIEVTATGRLRARVTRKADA